MAQDVALWVHQHGAIYRRILEALRATPVTGTASAFLAHRAVPLMHEIFDHSAYIAPDASGSVTYSMDVKDGTPAIFWDGAKLLTRPYDAHEHALSDFKNIGRKLMDLGGKDATILDIGAGTSIQAITLRALGCRFPVIALDLFPDALSIGKRLCSSLGIQGVMFGTADLTTEQHLSSLAEIVPRDRPIIALSRHAIYPFYSAPQYERLFDCLVRDVGVAGGVHLERTGRFTPAFKAIQAQFASELQVPRKHLDKNDDPLTHLAARNDITVKERVEVWPHYLETYFPSYLSWVRR